MYSLPNNNKTKLVKINGKSPSNNKRTKKNFQLENLDYLTQIVRKKNKEIKRGGTKKNLSKLLSNNEEIERLLSGKSSSSKSNKNPIEEMLESRQAKPETPVVEVSLTETPFLKKVENNRQAKKQPHVKKYKSENFLQQVLENKRNQETKSQVSIKKEKPNNTQGKSQTPKIPSSKVKKTPKITKPKNKTKKKSFPKELEKLPKKISQKNLERLIHPKMEIKKNIQKKNLKNLKKSQAHITLSNSNSKKEKKKVIYKKSKKKTISSNLRAPQVKLKKTQVKLKKTQVKLKKTQDQLKGKNKSLEKGQDKNKNKDKDKSKEKDQDKNKDKDKNTDKKKIETKKKESENKEVNLYQQAVQNVIGQDKKTVAKVEEMSKKEIRDKLIELKLIQPHSKAPVKVLRDIYSFYDMNQMILESN